MTHEQRVNGLPVPPSWAAVPFDLERVRLGDSIFRDKRDRVLAYLRAQEPDRILASFRRNAGIDDRGAAPPGGWDDSTGNLRGHYSGHLLSALSLAWAGTGEEGFRAQVAQVVTGLAECQQALAAQVGTPGDLPPEATWVKGRFGQGLDLDGLGQHLALPDATVDGSHAVTLALWVRPRSVAPGTPGIHLGTGDRSYLALDLAGDTGTPTLSISTGGPGRAERLVAPTPLDAGRWTHLAATLGGDTATLVVDGVTVASADGFSLTPADLGAPKDNWVGRSPTGAFLDGTVDEVHLHDRVLSRAELTHLAEHPGDEGTRGSLSAYALDDGVGAVARDESGRGWHAAVVTGAGNPPGPSHPGYLAAYPETQFLQLESLTPYPAIWAPWYTCHKILKGLLDAYTLTGNTQALDVARGLGEWAHHRITRVPVEQRQRMWATYIAGETGGMNEALADLHTLTGEPRFLDAATCFDYDELVTACVEGRDTLDGRHANQHLPPFLGQLRLAEVGAGDHRLAAARAFHADVAQHRTYAHGGTGQAEVLRARDAVAGTIVGDTNAETCATHNLLRLGRGLFLHRPDSALVDDHERGLVNHILGSRADADSTTDPLVTYMVPVSPGSRRAFGNLGTCCGGTGLENHTKLQDTVFLRSPDHRTLWVNLPVAAELDWPERGLRVVQTGAYPSEGPTTITVHGTGRLSLRVRVPGWASSMTLTLNGSRLRATPAPDGYADVDREWEDGDLLVVETPHAFRLEPTPDDPDVQALFCGPVLLLAQSEQTDWLRLPLDADDPSTLDQLGRDGDGARLGDLAFRPMHEGTTTAYHAYHRRLRAHRPRATPA